MHHYIHYILEYLLNQKTDCENIISAIGYCNDPALFHQYKLIIVPSGFFEGKNYGTTHSLPELPLQEIENIPLLFGVPEVTISENQIIVKADIIASSFFLISRYEEYVNRESRDFHGRFCAHDSLAYRAHFLERPVVDEYGKLLRHWLRLLGFDLKEPEEKIENINFTIDIDIPYYFRSIKGLAKSLLSITKPFNAIQTFFLDRTKDPAFTFDWLHKKNASLPKNKIKEIYFFKSKGQARQDKPYYSLFSEDIKFLFDFCKSNNIEIGLHSSYGAGEEPQLIFQEKEQLEYAAGTTITSNRHHFLSCREPEDFSVLEKIGITDDFTMGFADAVGFRLGCCRPVLWINPADQKVSKLKLHPLMIMDCTLDRPDYMNLSFEEAAEKSLTLLHQTKLHHGELTLLWHNHYLDHSEGGWQRELYRFIIQSLLVNV
ncbi:MAG: polysaccharide deacetylase family protein [Bacteroidales bacterium]|jgi:hypothetical protein|nr:polysaccharide deacetylase family protein [Bacteroidales bacterium]